MSRLHVLACDAITQSHDDALNEISSRKVRPTQWETKFILHLCKAMAPVAHGWKSELTTAAPGLAISMATVFTHQTPYVKWGSGVRQRRCELADLLVVFIDRKSSTPKGRAVLVQAKLSKSGSASLSNTSERNQFDLLSTRPIFDIDRKSAPTQIDLSSFAPDCALMYGLTSSSATHLPSPYPGVHHWLSADGLRRLAGTYSVTSKDCLAYMLIGMLLGKFGWEFDLPPRGHDWRAIAATSPRDGWSTLINYLLEETFSKSLSKAHSASIGRPIRGKEHVLHLSKTNSSGQPMFFIGYETADSIAMKLSAERGATEAGNWRSGRIDNRVSASGGGSTNNGDDTTIGNSPEGGPISVILFEVGRQN